MARLSRNSWLGIRVNDWFTNMVNALRLTLEINRLPTCGRYQGTLLATLGFERSGGCFFGYAGGQPPHNMTTPTTMNGQPTLATLFIRPMYQATNASPT